MPGSRIFGSISSDFSFGDVKGSVVDPHHVVADPDSTYHPVADTDSDIFLCGSGSEFSL